MGDLIVILTHGHTGPLDWCAATRSYPGQLECGDAHGVFSRDGSTVLLVADGLGHGPEAATAARIAVEVAAETAGAPIEVLRRCHDRLKTLRGAAVAVAVVDERSLELGWVSVGNLEAGICTGPMASARTRLFVRPGIVGHRLPELRPTLLQLKPGDHLVIGTDGVDDRFLDDLVVRGSPAEVVVDLMNRFGRGNDDALLIVARVERSAS